jgi:cbb3-type cytochrome oxidase subunit 3
MADTYINPITLKLFLPVAVSLAALVWLAIQGTRTALWATLVMSVLTLAVWVWTIWQSGNALSPGVTSISKVAGDFLDIFSTALLIFGFFTFLLPVWCIFVAMTLSVFWFKRRRARDQVISIESV